jgi:hypothetical protein
MSGLFLSYSRADRALAEQIIRGLRAVGVAVWWDEDMRAVDWQQELEHRIHELAGVMVIWTEHSVNSDHVRDEARLGLETQKLVNVLDGVNKPPFPYDRINGLPLAGWTGREPHRGWTRLVGTVEEMVVQAGFARPGDITVALAMREQEMRQKGDAIVLAQEALAAAQGREADAADAANAAVAALRDMEEQLQRVAEMRPTAAILRAAQEEFYAVSAARDEAEQAKKTAKAATEAASREIARAKADLDTMLTAPVDAPILPDRKGPPPRPRREPLPERVEPPPAEPEPLAPPTAAKPRKARPAPQPAAPAPLAEAPAPVVAAPAPSVAANPPRTSSEPDWLGRQFASPTRRWLAISAAVAAVFIVVAVAMSHHPSPPAAPAPAEVAAPQSGLPEATAHAAQALAGDWSSASFPCDTPYALAVKGDVLSVTTFGKTAALTIEADSPPGAVRVHAVEGDYSYSVARNRILSVVDPSGATSRMTRCAG